MFFELKTNLIDAQNKIDDIIESYSNALNQDYSPILLQMTATLFEYRKIKAIEKVSGTKNDALLECLTVSMDDHLNQHFGHVDTMAMFLEDECCVVLDKIKKCQQEIKAVYLQYSHFLFHASSVLGLKCIKASKNRLNAYRNEILNSIFACSDFSAITQFILRSASGSMYVLHNDIIILPSNPCLNRENGVLRLARPVDLYSIEASLFFPVVDFRELNGKYYIFFCGEWHAPTSSLSCNQETFLTISETYYQDCSIYFYNGSDTDEYDNKCLKYSTESNKEKLLCEISDDSSFTNLI